MIRIASALVLVASLSACVAPQAPSESRPSVSTLNTVQSADACTVVSARTVHLATPYLGENRSRYATNTGPRQNMGTAGGALVGGLIGKELGGSDGAAIGALIGAFAGGAYGAQSDATAPYAYGQEIVARLANGRTIVVTQGISGNDRGLYAGQRCLVVSGGRGGSARIVAG
jgi:outer membrane lipoprotein SlyB